MWMTCQDLEEALPLMKADALKTSASSYKASTIVAADDLHAKVPLDLST